MAATVGIAATSIPDSVSAENPMKANLPHYGFLIDVEKCSKVALENMESTFYPLQPVLQAAFNRRLSEG